MSPARCRSASWSATPITAPTPPTPLNLTPKLAVTAGGRFNIANIALNDQDPPDPNAPGAGLTGRHDYTHVNPAIGATYDLSPLVTVYGGFSEANAAPHRRPNFPARARRTPAPWQIFSSGDPNLKQIVSRTVRIRHPRRRGRSGRA